MRGKLWSFLRVLVLTPLTVITWQIYTGTEHARMGRSACVRRQLNNRPHQLEPYRHSTIGSRERLQGLLLLLACTVSAWIWRVSGVVQPPQR